MYTPRSALLTGTSRQISLIRVTLMSRAPSSTTVNCNPHPAPTGGDVAASMASNHPSLLTLPALALLGAV